MLLNHFENLIITPRNNNKTHTQAFIPQTHHLFNWQPHNFFYLSEFKNKECIESTTFFSFKLKAERILLVAIQS
jgi:hypothetical protein